MFNSIKHHVKQFQVYHYIAIIMAVVLQIQITLFAQDDYLGIRVNLGDLFIPFIGLFVLYTLLMKKSLWPNWSVPKMNYWLAGLILVMSVALFNGYIVNGFLSTWALINKYIGFLILIAYLALGGWLSTNAKNNDELLNVFSSSFANFFVIILCLSVGLFFLQNVSPVPLWLSDYPWDGFMANRNSYVVIFVMTAIFLIGRTEDYKVGKQQWSSILFWFCMPMFLIYNESRTGWVAALILVLLFLSKTPLKRGKFLIPILVIGSGLAYSSYYFTTDSNIHVHNTRNIIDLSAPQDEQYFTDQQRFLAIEDGMDLYTAHDPLVGAGLGTYKYFQIEKRGKFHNVIDFTALWLLVETGIIGLLIFISFFIICAWSLYQSGYNQDKSAYHKSMLFFLIMFAGMSLLHELMYTRILWFAMGLALGHPISRTFRL